MLLKGDFVYRSNSPIEIVSASGCTLETAQECKILDLESSSGACVLGYRSDLIQSALNNSLFSLPSKPQFCESENRWKVADWLNRKIFSVLNVNGSIGFDIGGAQAVEQSIKIVSSKNKSANIILTFEGCYHGRSIATSYLSSSERYQTNFSTGPFKVMLLPVPYFLSQSLGIEEEEATSICMKQVDALFSDERFGLIGRANNLHSLIFEPVLNVAGIIPLPVKYLNYLIEKVRLMGGAVIADEIFTGFYKNETFLSSSNIHNIDIVLLSKGITNGISPLAALWVNEASDLARYYLPGTHSSTYINNELSFAIALETFAELDQIVRDGCISISYKIEIILSGFEGVSGVSMCRIGNMARVEFSDLNFFECFKMGLLAARKVGLLFATTSLAKKCLILHPSYSISIEECTLARDVINEILNEIDR